MTATVSATLVDLRVCWGSQSRHQCPTCLRFLPKGEQVDCPRCQVAYVREPGSDLFRTEARR